MNKKFLAALIALVLVVTGGTVIFLFQQKDRISKLPVANQSQSGNVPDDGSQGDIVHDGVAYIYNKKLKNVLFLGVDKAAGSVVGEHVGRNGQADCILLLIMNEETKETTLLQISRDSMADIEIYGVGGDRLATEHQQIALQYAFGESEAKSCWLMKNAVSKLLYDIPISSTMALSVDGIGALTTAMGGVELTVPEDYTSVDPSFVQGTVVNLQGSLAERYVRYRDITVMGSNNGRMERQNQFIQAMFQQMKGVDTASFNTLLESADPYLTTDLSAEELRSLKNFRIKEEMEKVPGTAAPGPEHEEFTVDEQQLYELILKLFYVPVEGQ